MRRSNSCAPNMVPIVTALTAAWPLYGFPSIKEYFIRRLAEWQDDRIARDIAALGYSANEANVTVSTAVAVIDQQFNRTMAQLRPTQDEPKVTSVKTSLFD